MAPSPQKLARTAAALTPSDVQSRNPRKRLGPARSPLGHPPETPPFEGRAGGPVRPLSSSNVQRYPIRSRLIASCMPVLSHTASGTELLRSERAGGATERAPIADIGIRTPVAEVPIEQKPVGLPAPDLNQHHAGDVTAVGRDEAGRDHQPPGLGARTRTTPLNSALNDDDNNYGGFLLIQKSREDAHWTDDAHSSQSSYVPTETGQLRPEVARSAETETNGRAIQHFASEFGENLPNSGNLFSDDRFKLSPQNSDDERKKYGTST